MNQEYERNHSHYHCWEQVDNEDSDKEPQDTPACGQPLKNHKQCCLCDTLYEAMNQVSKCNCGRPWFPDMEHTDKIEKDCKFLKLKTQKEGYNVYDKIKKGTEEIFDNLLDKAERTHLGLPPKDIQEEKELIVEEYPLDYGGYKTSGFKIYKNPKFKKTSDIQDKGWSKNISEKFVFMINQGIEDNIWTEDERTPMMFVLRGILEEVQKEIDSSYTKELEEGREEIDQKITEIIGRHNARILNEFQKQGTPEMPLIAYDETICLIPAMTKATEETLGILNKKDE